MKIHYLDDDEIALLKQAGKKLAEYQLTVGTAESCTGGRIANMLASEPESSEHFIGGIISYSEEVKKKILGVESQDLEKYGVVSQPIADQMVYGACQVLKCPCSIATTGYAGPEGGSDENPVGTIWIAVKIKGEIHAKRFLFSGDRQEIIRQASNRAVQMFLKILD